MCTPACLVGQSSPPHGTCVAKTRCLLTAKSLVELLPPNRLLANWLLCQVSLLCLLFSSNYGYSERNVLCWLTLCW
ncbi:hypothetical protein GE21DRAFT_1255497 [Neurospora crassa]|nr:hypothetical protein GE21DRAFT_1255497 [Neurospora crassa]